MPVVKHEPDFAELVDCAAEKRNEIIQKWNNEIYNLYGSSVDPVTLYYRKLTGKIAPVSSDEPSEKNEGGGETTNNPTNDIPVATNTPPSTLKLSSLAYMFIIGPLMYPRSLVICFAILTLLFRLSDVGLRESTASLSDTLDIIINIYFIFEGIVRLCTIPAVFEIRKRHFEKEIPPTNSLTYEILRCGWIEIIISISSTIIISQFESTNAICWFNLFRLSFIANCYVLELPQIEVLLSGIYSGLRSIVSTWFLLIITFVIYGVLCTASFRENDPAHFSTVGTSMFSLFRISTMDNWSQVNQINAYGCDAVASEYVRILKSDPTPRYINVIAGRMYLFYCDAPDGYPYLSAFIFTSFVVLTGFMLISLTIAAVSGGVHMSLDQIQRQQHEKELEFVEDILDSRSDVGAADQPISNSSSKESSSHDVKRSTRAQTFYGKGGVSKTQSKPSSSSSSSQSQSQLQTKTSNQNTDDSKSIRKSLSNIESLIEESEEDDVDSDKKSAIMMPKIARRVTPFELIDLEKQDSKSSSEACDSLPPPDFSWDGSDDEVVVRAVSSTSAQLTLLNLQQNQESVATKIGQEAVTPTPELSSRSLISPVGESTTLPTQITPSSSHRSGKKNPITRTATLKEDLPLLQDKELLKMILDQMWQDVKTMNETQVEEANNSSEGQPSSDGGGGPEDKLGFIAKNLSVIGDAIASRDNDSNRRLSIPTNSRLNTQQPTTLNQRPMPGGAALQRHGSILAAPIEETNIVDSSKKIAYALRNILSSYYYLGYLILLVIITAGIQIFCTNQNNCRDYWWVFIVVQVLLSFDILLRIWTHYPTYKTFFYSKNNLFDVVLVLVIWIPMYYTGYGSQIAESARILYLLRLLPLLSWVSDLQVIMLSIVSSIRPLLYVVGIMFLMFFHFSVAGVLIFRRNDKYYFGSLFRAMNTLFQICTLDNWGDIALKNMYGCDHYGKDTGVEDVDEMCVTPLGLGWIAAWYFMIFITLSVMVLQSLFVGIIISAMELLKDGVSQEANMWKIIYQKVDKYGLQNSTLMNLLEVFNAMDDSLNGYLTEKDLEPILKVLKPMSSLPNVNCKVKGEYTFPEFLDLIYFLGLKLRKLSRLAPTK